MNASLRKLYTTLAVIIIAVVTLVAIFIPRLNQGEQSETPVLEHPEMTIQDKAILTLKEIVGLDLTKYEMNVTSIINPFDDYEGSLVEDVICRLQSNESIIIIPITFVNKTLWRIDISPYKSSLDSAHYVKRLPTDPLSATRILLQRAQEYYQNPTYLKTMLDSLDSVNDLDSINTTIGTMKREAIVHSESIQIRFMYTFGEARDSPKSVNFNFMNGVFNGLGNGWKLFKIRNENLIVSREQAIATALELGNKASSNELKLRNESIRADLHLLPKEPFVLHPFWFVNLPLASPTPSSNSSEIPYTHAFTQWQVGIWADTGIIEYSHPA